MSLNWVDLGIVVVIGLSMLTGIIRGFMKEVIALTIWVLAFWLAYHYTATAEVFLQPYVKDPSARKAAGFLIIFIAALFSGGVLNMLLGLILKRSGLSGMDRLLGMVFGFVRGIFVVALVIVVLKMASISGDGYFQQSALFPRFSPLVHWMSLNMPNVINQVEWMESTLENPQS